MPDVTSDNVKKGSSAWVSRAARRELSSEKLNLLQVPGRESKQCTVLGLRVWHRAAELNRVEGRERTVGLFLYSGGL